MSNTCINISSNTTLGKYFITVIESYRNLIEKRRRNLNVRLKKAPLRYRFVARNTRPFRVVVMWGTRCLCLGISSSLWLYSFLFLTLSCF